MTEIPVPVMNVIMGALGGAPVAWWLLRRHVERVDRIETRLTSIETSLSNLATKDVVATKDDWTQVSARLDRVDSTLDQVKDLLARLDERWKLKHGD